MMKFRGLQSNYHHTLLEAGWRGLCPVRLLPATLCLLAVFFASPRDASAQAVLTDDAHASNAPKALDANYGNNPNLNVSSAGNIYVKFKLSSTLPAGTPGPSVERATLKLYLANVTAPGKLDIYAVTGTWDEATLTAGNAPPLGELVATTAQIDTDRRGKFIVVDVTPLVRRWLGDDGLGTNGAPNHGLALVANATTSEVANITFDSKENSQTSHEPQLNIVLKQGTGSALTELSADAPLTVTDPTTEPHISLGIVPPAKGGTGLSSAGAAGNFLRSDGSSWTSGPLAASDLPAESGSYIQNTTSQQASSNFNINGDGKANIFDAATQYNIGGKRVLSNRGFRNVFAGEGAGTLNTGLGNAFFGFEAGANNANAGLNAFFGFRAGQSNTTGCCNSFFGNEAGVSNVSGRSNVFVGGSAGEGNSDGSFNTFVGDAAGWNFNNDAGNATGNLNTFLGYATGSGGGGGNKVTLVGANANVGAPGLDYATAIGAEARVSASNTVVLGRGVDTVRVPGALKVAGAFEVNIIDAAAQYNIAGNRVLSMAGSFNLFAGANAGASITSGNSNAFFGRAAGNQTTTGSANSFFGRDAGLGNVGGSANSFFGFEAGKVNTAGFNSFFGHQAGLSNTVAIRNSFFGALAGLNTTTGGSNSYFGIEAGKLNTDGGFNSFFGDGAGVSNNSSNNSFFGFHSGLFNTSGYSNSFFGSGAGGNNTTGSDNTFIGYAADFDVSSATGDGVTLIGTRARAASALSNATAVGSDAKVTSSNSLVLGSISGVNGAGVSTNVGVGTTAPRTRLHVTGGKVYVEANGQGLVLKSPAGACFELTVTNAGTLAVVAMAACP